MTIANALLFPAGFFDSDSSAPAGQFLLWEDAALILLEDGSGYMLTE